VTVQVNPPIPVRSHDWMAYLEDYGGGPDAGWQAMGSGPTKRDALIDLAQSIEDHEED
jgi:hypothetical protein